MFTQVDPRGIKGCFAGCLVDALNNPTVIERILELTGLFHVERKVTTSALKVAYVGTALYDVPNHFEQLTRGFQERGCIVRELCVAEVPHARGTFQGAKNTIDLDQLHFLGEAKVILVPEGNTLYAVRRWEETGLDVCLRAAAVRGAVLVGSGCFFDGMHCDSANPSTYADAVRGSGAAESAENGKGQDPQEKNGAWPYIRVHGLGILPGLLCPHHDARDAKGVLRKADFNKMLKRHSGERGLGIDCTAVLMLLGDGNYEVLVMESKEQRGDKIVEAGVQVKNVVNGVVHSSTVPLRGSVKDLLITPHGPVLRDPFEVYYAMANPTGSTEKLLCLPA
ncbi:putative Peptidase family S51 [Trypanosoma vivax]|uniref:Cyclin 1 n=1 Tax=Trypanosoma vivax (strain Y486) TaxID=1055687 RepID=G0U8E6_TRYVY|nr:cyclin 1 [Trypanosoma vivax]KAH8605098.1 putative Peptidase family S51 [Trypanosoma vivax]CCC53870.1 cyclin 1 [Trypanosoma vivax Y486]